jgi:peroxiredoxin
VITIAVKSGKNSELNKYMKENNLDFKVFNDKDGKIAKSFNIQAYPTTFVYNKERKPSFSDVGYTSTWGLKLRLWWATF